MWTSSPVNAPPISPALWAPTLCTGFDARGLIFGAPLALALKVPFVPLRKPGKLPGAYCVSNLNFPLNTVLQARLLQQSISPSTAPTKLSCKRVRKLLVEY